MIKSTILKKLLQISLIISILENNLYAQTQSEISMLYVTIFNRASEGEGNQFWQNLDYSMEDTATEMLESSDAKAYFGSSLDNNQDFIEHIYLNTLNKTSTVDPEGITFWVSLLDNGMSRGRVVKELIEAVVNGDYSGDIDALNAQAQFNNRVIISNYMADRVFYLPNNYAEVTGFSRGLNVTYDNSTLNSTYSIIDNLSQEKPPKELSYQPITIYDNFDSSNNKADIIIKGAGEKLHQTWFDENKNITQIKYSDKNSNVTVFYDNSGNPSKMVNNINDDYIVIKKKDNTIDYLFYQNDKYVSTNTIRMDGSSYSVNSENKNSTINKKKKTLNQKISFSDIGVIAASAGIAAAITSFAVVSAPVAVLLSVAGIALMTGDAVKSVDEKGIENLTNYISECDSDLNILDKKQSYKFYKSLSCNQSKEETMDLNSMLFMGVEEEQLSSQETFEAIRDGVNQELIDFIKETTSYSNDISEIEDRVKNKEEVEEKEPTVTNFHLISPPKNICESYGGSYYSTSYTCTADWYTAKSICSAIGGFLPTKEVVEEIHKYSPMNAAASFWSSITNVSDSSSAWYFMLFTGYGYWYNKTKEARVCCVQDKR